MKLEKVGNPFGGSAGGGGYDYQAETYGLIAAKILAQESLNWVETGCDRVPILINMETGSGGDDLRITLRHGAKIELQSKRGLQRGENLWYALLTLARAVNADSDTYGVLLTNTEASNTIREHLKNGIIRVGQGIANDLPEIVDEFLKHLQDNGLKNLSHICSHIRIVIRDFDPGSSGEEETFATLRKLVAEPEMVGAARNTLVSDGHDLIKVRGSRDTSSIARVVQQAGIHLLVSPTTQVGLPEAFINWSIKVNEKITIPSLNIVLPISKAWVRLRAMASQGRAKGSELLADQIRKYHEWHRLADDSYTSDTLDIEAAARSNRLLVVVGGPGSGKSTLLRRLAHVWSTEGQVVLKASLRAVALRTSRGETFDEALLAVASEGFPHVTEMLYGLLRDSSCLLVDGLDETDPNRLDMVERLRRWALANTERRVILTTRPVGHNPAWFEEWEHYELLPLGQPNISEFAETIFDLLYPNDLKRAAHMSSAFLEELNRSRTASIAARNPQLLGFLIVLYINSHDIGGGRFRLFGKVIEEIRKQTIPDRVFQYEMDSPIAYRVMEYLGWLISHNPTLPEDELVESIGQQLAEELSLQSLQGQQIASKVLSFWEERGLVERVSAGVTTAFTFVHLAFQEFAATRFLVQLPEEKFTEWIRSEYNVPRFRETLLLTGGTKRLALAVNALLEMDDASNPVSIAGLLAADVLAEAEELPADLRDCIFQQLVPRLTSSVPMVVHEAGERLRPLAILSPVLIGPMALGLAKHEHPWTREVACALGLLSGDDYVDVDSLLEVFPIVIDSTFDSMPGGGLIIRDSKPLISDLLIKGAEYLLKDNPAAHHLEVVKAKYRGQGYSIEVRKSLHELLAKHLTLEEIEGIRPIWFDKLELSEESKRALREAKQAFIEAVLNACDGLSKDEIPPATVSLEISSLALLVQVLKFGEAIMPEVYTLRKRHLQDAFVEVIRGAILVTSLKPEQVKADAKQALLKLAQSQNFLYSLISTSEEFEPEVQLDWALAQGRRLKVELLFRAMSHPSWFVCRFAALLLWECIERDVVRTGLKEVLARGSGYALSIIAHVASELWQGETLELVLDRLERNLTYACAPLVKLLGEICNESAKSRAESVLLNALKLRDVGIVHAALDAIDKLDVDSSLATPIRDCYLWWLREGPQDLVAGGVVPENAAVSLFSHLSAKKKLNFDEVCEAANSRCSDVRGVAIKAICQFLAQEDELVESTIDGIGCGKFPIKLLKDLSRSYPNVCNRHFESFLRLLNSDNRSVQIACIWSLGDGWADYREVENKLRPFLNAPDLRIRDETVRALRRLRIGHRILG